MDGCAFLVILFFIIILVIAFIKLLPIIIGLAVIWLIYQFYQYKNDKDSIFKEIK